ncbi:MAG: LuxR C-terminal-related transcriptional regulator [Chloroflexota bacterium]|nr:LuxR C-terminal-related transcriptional regulator [Chloroflexota bacterium]
MSSSNIDAFPLIKTKLRRPAVPVDMVPRPRLTGWLDRYRQRPLTLVSAPAGYGKSTLVSAWLEECDCPSAWVSLDEYDNDMLTFLGYLIAAIQTMFPEACRETAALLQVSEPPPARVIAGTLLNDWEHIEQPFVIVLDDYHVIHEESIHDLLDALLRYPPQSLHLVITTRTDPSLDLVNLRARGQVQEIRAHALRFQVEETAAFLQNLLHMAVDEEIARRLTEQTDGWVTGLRLSTLAVDGAVDLERIKLSLPGERLIADYLVAEALSRQPHVIQDWLLKSSILDRFCVSLCEAVCAPLGDQQVIGLKGLDFLNWLDRANLFVITLDERYEWRRYHHLFQRLLQQQLKLKFSEDEIVTLHSRASAWFTEHGLIEEALQHALAANDTATAVELVARHRHVLMNAEQWHRLRRWINLFPPRLVEEDLQLLITKAWIVHNRADISEIEAALNQAESLLNQQSPEPFTTKVLQAEIDALRFDLFQRKGEVQDIIPDALRAVDTFPHEWFRARGLALVYLSHAYHHTGDSDQAYQVIHDALDTDTSSSGAFHSLLLVVLCFLHWENARLPALGKIAKQYLQLGKKHNLLESIAFANYFLGCFHYHRNDLGKAETYLHAAASDYRIANARNTIQSACALALTYHALGKNDRADEIVAATTDFIYETDILEYLPVIEAAEAELNLRQGRYAEAAIWAHEYDPYPFPFLVRFLIPQLTFAKVLLALNNENNIEQISDLLFRLQEHIERLNHTRFKIDVLALQALHKDAHGDQTAALEKLGQSVRLAEPGGWIRPFVDLGPKMASLLYRLRNQDAAQGYISQILDAFPGPKTSELSDSRVNLVEPLTAREMEILGLLAQQLSNKEIAAELVISHGTVKQHTHNIYQKLDVNTRRQAVTTATELGILVSQSES